MNMNIPPLEHFVDNKVLSLSMASKFEFPLLRHNICFNEVLNGSVRVTRSKKKIESVVTYCTLKKESLYFVNPN